MQKDNKKKRSENRGKMIAAFVRFLVSIKKYRLRIIFSIILAIGSATLGIFIPKLLGDMTNIAVNTYPDIDFGAIIAKVITVVILFVASAGLNYAQAYILVTVSAKYTKELREQIIDKISRFHRVQFFLQFG